METTGIKILIFCVLLMSAYSCKKKKETATVETESVPTVTPFVPTKIDGDLTAFYHIEMSGDSNTALPLFVGARFFKQAHPIDSVYSLTNDADVGNVSVSGNALLKDTSGGRVTYNLVVESPINANKLRDPRVWNISGNESYVETQFTDNTAVPSYSISSAFPDTIYMDRDNTINVGVFSGTDSIDVIIYNKYGGASTNPITLGHNQHVAKFSKNEFLHFYWSSSPYDFGVKFILYKESYQIVSGKILRSTLTVRYVSPTIPFKFAN